MENVKKQGNKLAHILRQTEPFLKKIFFITPIRTLILIIFQIITFLFLPRNVFAISKIEKILKNHPVKFSFIIFGVCGVFIGFLLLLSYYKVVFKAISALITSKKKAERTRIPTGKIKNTSLPNARLILKEPGGGNKNFIITPRKEFWIGRDEDNELILKDEIISRKHAKIRPEKEGYVLYDMLSRNGTRVNRKKIKGHVLRNGDEIFIRPYSLIFDEEGEEGE